MCVIVNLVCNLVLVLVRMSHPLAAACQNASGGHCVCVCESCVLLGPCASQDVPSFGSSLSR